MTFIKVDRDILFSASEEMVNISSEVSRLNRDYYDTVSNLELEIRDCCQIRKIADRLNKRLENESSALQNIGRFLAHAAEEYAFFDDTSGIPNNQETGSGVDNVGGGTTSDDNTSNSQNEYNSIFDGVPILESLEKLIHFYGQVITEDDHHSAVEDLRRWWQAIDDNLSLWNDLYSEMEKIWEGLKDLPVGEVARWIPLVNVINSTGTEALYWYSEYMQDGEYSFEEILKTVIYASTNGLMHVGTDLIDVFSMGTAVPESVVFDKIIDEGGSREIADTLIEWADETGTWIGETIANLRRKWR